MTKPKVKKIEFLYQNQIKRRQIKVTLTNKRKVYIYPCCESWEQVGAYDDLFITMPIAKKYNNGCMAKETSCNQSGGA